MKILSHRFERDKGFWYFKNHKSFLQMAFSMTKPGKLMNDEELIEFARVMLYYNRSIINQPFSISPADKVFRINDFPECDAPFAYCYTTKKVIDNFISKDIFKIGTIKHYQKIEKKEARDLFEGYSVINVRTLNAVDVVSVAMSGFDHYIYCASLAAPSSENGKILRNKFGSCVVKIDINKFIESLKNALRAQSATVRAVKYSDANVYRSLLAPYSRCKEQGQNLSAYDFDYLLAASRLPSLFVKSCSFQEEMEVRFAFEMDQDVPDNIILRKKGLLNCCEILKF